MNDDYTAQERKVVRLLEQAREAADQLDEQYPGQATAFHQGLRQSLNVLALRPVTRATEAARRANQPDPEPDAEAALEDEPEPHLPSEQPTIGPSETKDDDE